MVVMVVVVMLQVEVEENLDFIRSVIPRLDWPGVYAAAQSVCMHDGDDGDDVQLRIAGVPEFLPPNAVDNIELLKALHQLLMQVRIIMRYGYDGTGGGDAG